MDKVIPPMLPLLACMVLVLLFVTYFPEVFMWISRGAGFAK
jgi:TRAP-type C4-dicarboxylate transport system permease large subunit